MTKNAIKPEINWYLNNIVDAWCPNCDNIAYSSWDTVDLPDYCPHCSAELDWSELDGREWDIPEDNSFRITHRARQCRGRTMSGSKSVKGYPVRATSGTTYMITLADDSDENNIRFEYVAIKSDSVTIKE
jgi:hypothetical protein